jgi:hypothetical protein
MRPSERQPRPGQHDVVLPYAARVWYPRTPHPLIPLRCLLSLPTVSTLKAFLFGFVLISVGWKRGKAPPGTAGWAGTSAPRTVPRRQNPRANNSGFSKTAVSPKGSESRSLPKASGASGLTVAGSDARIFSPRLRRLRHATEPRKIQSVRVGNRRAGRVCLHGQEN